MTPPAPTRTRRPTRPTPQPDEKMGVGAWVLVGVCVLAGAGLLIGLRARVVRTVPVVESAAPAEAPRAAPAEGTGQAPPPEPAGPPASSPAGGEGKVSMTPREGLRVLWVRPQGVVPAYPQAAIEVAFSSAMDRASVQQAFEISPEVSGIMEWPRPDQMLFRPRRPLDLGAEYKVRLSAAATDLQHQEGLQPYEWGFQVHRAYSWHNVGRIVRYACETCHGAGRAAARVPLGNYEQVMRYVQKGNAAASPLYAVLGDARHRQVPADWQGMYYVIKEWIDKGDAAE